MNLLVLLALGMTLAALVFLAVAVLGACAITASFVYVECVKLLRELR